MRVLPSPAASVTSASHRPSRAKVIHAEVLGIVSGSWADSKDLAHRPYRGGEGVGRARSRVVGQDPGVRVSGV